jgi:hypothetical protein
MTSFRVLALTAALLGATAALAQDETVRVTGRRVLHTADLYAQPPLTGPAHTLDLTLAYFLGSGWEEARIAELISQAASMLAQCRVVVARAEIVAIEAPENYRYYATPSARIVARRLELMKPTVYFVVDTRQQPAFDAEAIGTVNSRTRPELTGTVWITRGARDPAHVLAHELVHMLADSGAHADEPGNLMREDTDARNTALTAAQCAGVIARGTSNGWLQPRR